MLLERGVNVTSREENSLHHYIWRDSGRFRGTMAYAEVACTFLERGMVQVVSTQGAFG